MENNSDKQLRDKLKGVEAPFDPRAWEQMEAMLDKKKKRRGFFWWWASGVAALLLVGVVAYELGVNVGKSKVKSQKVKENTGAFIGKSKVKSQRSKENTGVFVENTYEAENGKTKEENTVSAFAKGNESAAISRGKAAKHEITSADALLLSSNAEETHHHKTLKEKRKQQWLKKSREEINTLVTAFEKNNSRKQEETFASATAQTSPAERIEMERREGLLETNSEEYSLDKKNEDALPKRKKKIFNYSLGVIANITGTTLGSQNDNRPSRPPLFYNKPSYAVGFAHDFLFFNRIAISNSILYAQTGFKVYQPNTPNDSFTTTKSYSSSISELQIPVGIKAYPVVKKFFRFYISAGIINHIKLKEIFTVEKEAVPVVSSMVTYDNTTVSTNSNPFVGSNNKSVTVQNANYTRGEQAEYFGMGGLSRYYASFYASAGAEAIVKRHFVFFAEPMFYMGLNKIGLQNNRKYNVGVNGGLRYSLAR